MAEGVKRAYDSTRRREQAEQTRLQILEAAQRLFERDGYATTTVAAIAAEAGVATKTVYLAFETKSGILRALWHLLLRGDQDDTPVSERDWYRQVVEERDPERKLRLSAHQSRVVKERAGRVMEVIRAGRRADPDVARSGTGSRPTSTRSSKGSPRRSHRRGAARRASTSTRPPTSSGRSTTPTRGSCSSSGAAGRPSSGSTGSTRRSGPSC